MLCFDEKNRAYLRARRKSNYDKSKLLCFDEKNRVYLQAHRNSNHEKSNSCVLTRKKSVFARATEVVTFEDMASLDRGRFTGVLDTAITFASV